MSDQRLTFDYSDQPYFAFDPPLERAGDPLEESALRFHKANPHVLREIVQVCLSVKRRGRNHWSINAAFEVVRYNREITTTGKTYKLSNNHRAFYARWIMRDVPELAGFFATRDVGRVHSELD